jgi:hypothetical protein
MKFPLLALLAIATGTAVALAQNLPAPPPRIPQHEVHLYLSHADHARLLRSLERAGTEPNGLRLVKLELKEARMLMTSIFVASQGVEARRERKDRP